MKCVKIKSTIAHPTKLNVQPEISTRCSYMHIAPRGERVSEKHWSNDFDRSILSWAIKSLFLSLSNFLARCLCHYLSLSAFTKQTSTLKNREEDRKSRHCSISQITERIASLHSLLTRAKDFWLLFQNNLSFDTSFHVWLARPYTRALSIVTLAMFME